MFFVLCVLQGEEGMEEQFEDKEMEVELDAQEASLNQPIPEVCARIAVSVWRFHYCTVNKRPHSCPVNWSSLFFVIWSWNLTQFPASNNEKYFIFMKNSLRHLKNLIIW